MAFERDAFQNDQEGVFLPGYQVELVVVGSSPVKGPTRKIVIGGDRNDKDVLSFGMGADLGTTFGDVTVGESTFGEAHLTFGGFSDLATDITEIDIIGDADNELAALTAGAPRAVMIGLGKNELVEV